MKPFTLALAAIAALGAPSLAFASSVVELESNDTIATAQNLDAYFSLEANADIVGATINPHATVLGQSANSTRDYYSFTVTAGASGIFDIDYAQAANWDSYLTLRDFNGDVLAENDDDHGEGGPINVPVVDTAGGSSDPNHILDSAIFYTFASAGTYYIQVGNCCSSDTAHVQGAGYTLHVSVADHAVNGVPEPATWALMLMGFGALGTSLRQRRKLTA